MVKRKERPAETTEDGNDPGTPVSERAVGAQHTAKKQQLIALHRTRVLNWQPTPAVACEATDDGAVLAVARESGIIELWETDHWGILGVLYGSRDMALSCLAWMKDTSSGEWRLISGGLDGSLVEWDLIERRPAAWTDGLGGAVWAISAQPCTAENETAKLAVAGDDGCLRLFSLLEGQPGLVYSSSFPPLKSRLLSVDWHPSGQVVCTGTSEATLHAWNVATRREVRIYTGDEGKEQHDVWAVKVLPDGTIVSGDGGGNLQFWDAVHGTGICSLQQHRADILTIACSPDGQQVFASGIDNQVAVFRRIQSAHEGLVRWEYIESKRPHTHDVRFLTVVGGKDKEPLLLSGGNDAQLFAYSVEAFTKEHATRLSRTPDAPTIAMTRTLADASALVLSVQHEKGQLWSLDTSTLAMEQAGDSGREGLFLNGHKKPALLTEVQLSKGGHISVSALSRDGKHLFLGNAEESALYTVNAEACGEGVLEPMRLKLPKKIKPFHSAAFCGNSLILSDAEGNVWTLDLTLKQLKLTSLSNLALKGPSAKGNILPKLSNQIRSTASSEDDKVVALESASAVHLVSPDPSVAHVTIQIPKERGLVTAVAFKHGGGRVLVGTSTNSLLVYDVATQELAPLAADLKPVLQHKLNLLPGSIKFITPLPENERDAVIVATTSGMLFVDFEVPVPELQPIGKRERWRMMPSSLEAQAGKIGTNLRLTQLDEPCLACDFVSAKALVICEKEWEKVQESFPAPVYRQRFGT